MTAGELKRKLALMPEDTDLYMHCSGEFLPIDCVRYYKDDEEAVILPIKDAPRPPRK